MMAGSSVRIGVVLIVMAMAGHAMAASPSGKAIAVVQSTTIDGATGKRVLEPEAPVFAGDRIETGQIGTAQVRFRDDTKLVIGPNSSMVIDAFVFNNDDTAREISINVVKGAFRFITGNSRKDAYTITTPTATIGVRGTEFDIAVEREGTTRVANFEGETEICRRQPGGGVLDPQEDCVEVTEPCTLSVVRPTQREVVKYSNDDVEFRNRQLEFYFPYVRDQSRLFRDFQVDLTECNFSAVVRPGEPAGPAPGAPPPPPEEIPTPPDRPVEFDPPPPPSIPAGRHGPRPVFDHGRALR